MSFRGIFVGVLGLAGLEMVLSSQQGASRFGGLLTAVGSVVRHFLDPTIPAIPDLAGVGSISVLTYNANGTTTTTPGGQVTANAGGIPRHATP